MTPLLLRQWHGYIGAFIAPGVIFFALTGSLQLFNLHEAHGGYHPLHIVVRLGRLHKDQVFELDHDRPPPPADAGKPAAAGQPQPDTDEQPAVSTYLLKWFFLVVALGLVASTVFGIWIALTRPRGKTATIALLAAGTAIPVLLLAV